MNTEDLVKLQTYLREVGNTLVFKLKEEVAEAAERLNFLLDYALLSCNFIIYIHRTEKVVLFTFRL